MSGPLHAVLCDLQLQHGRVCRWRKPTLTKASETAVGSCHVGCFGANASDGALDKQIGFNHATISAAPPRSDMYPAYDLPPPVISDALSTVLVC